MALKLSGIVNAARKAIIGMQGRVTKSSFFLTNLTTPDTLKLAMTPEAIKLRTETSFCTYNIITKGEVKLPKGERLEQVGWSGILPGVNILSHNFVTPSEWQPPQEIARTLSRWRSKGDKIRLLVTQTPINLDCYIRSFDYTLRGGQGNIYYDIELLGAKELQVLTVEEADALKEQEELEEAQELKERAKENRVGQRLEKIDNAYNLAQVLTGNGGDWQRVADDYGLINPDEPIEKIIIN